MKTSHRDVVVAAPNELDAMLTDIVRHRLGGPDCLRILDAGCGRMWTWDLQGMPFHLTGLDSDADALRLRVEQRGDLDEWLAGDLRTVPLPPGHFDLVYSAYVLEHVDGAELVLDRMFDTLRPDGLMVIKIPDGDSVYGFLTRITPHQVHVLYKRWIRRKPLAGTPGHGPYPVVYDNVISLDGITAWASARDLEIGAAALGAGRVARARPPVPDAALEYNQALRFALLDAEHLLILISYVGALSAHEGDTELAEACAEWKSSLQKPARAARRAAIGLGKTPDLAVEPLSKGQKIGYLLGWLGEATDRRRAGR